jgi:hypothetical protein
MTNDVWYEKVADIILKFLPDADIHLFAEGKIARSLSSKYTVHGGGAETAINSLAHMVQADVLVMARSSFSYVPALANTNCVIYQHFWHHPLPEWIFLRGKLEMNTDRSGPFNDQYNASMWDSKGQVPPNPLFGELNDMEVLEKERGPTIARRFVLVHAALDKQLCHLEMTVLACDHKRGPTIAICFFLVHAFSDQLLTQLQIACAACFSKLDRFGPLTHKNLAFGPTHCFGPEHCPFFAFKLCLNPLKSCLV